MILRSLNSIRKGSVIRFLYEAKLIDIEDTIVDLKDADLQNASLRWASWPDN